MPGSVDGQAELISSLASIRIVYNWWLGMFYFYEKVNQDNAFFNKEDIEEVVFVGYIDISFQELNQRYDELVDKIEYPRFSITDFKQ